MCGWQRELLESRERCASLTHDLRHAKSVMDKMKTEIRTVKALKEQLYDVEMQTRRLKEQVTANMRDKLQWKTRALKLKKEVKKAQETAARTRAKPDGAEKGGGIGGSGWVAGGTGRTASRPGEILPVVTRGQTGYAQGDEVQHSKTLKSVDFGDSASDDEEWGEQEDLGDSPVKGLHHGDGHDGNVGRSGASTSPVMNFSRVYSRGECCSLSSKPCICILLLETPVEIRTHSACSFSPKFGDCGAARGRRRGCPTGLSSQYECCACCA